jgi:hypothetical protein
MSAFGGKADMTRTPMSAFDPKRTWTDVPAVPLSEGCYGLVRCAVVSPTGGIGFTNLTIVLMNFDDWQKEGHPFIKGDTK